MSHSAELDAAMKRAFQYLSKKPRWWWRLQILRQRLFPTRLYRFIRELLKDAQCP